MQIDWTKSDRLFLVTKGGVLLFRREGSSVEQTFTIARKAITGGEESTDRARMLAAIETQKSTLDRNAYYNELNEKLENGDIVGIIFDPLGIAQ